MPCCFVEGHRRRSRAGIESSSVRLELDSVFDVLIAADLKEDLLAHFCREVEEGDGVFGLYGCHGCGCGVCHFEDEFVDDTC